MGRARRANVAIFTRWLRDMCTKRCTGTRHAFTPARHVNVNTPFVRVDGQTHCIHAEIKASLPAALQSRITVIFVAGFSSGNKEDGFIIGTYNSFFRLDELQARSTGR